jgi:hypothetical protein
MEIPQKPYMTSTRILNMCFKWKPKVPPDLFYIFTVLFYSVFSRTLWKACHCTSKMNKMTLQEKPSIEIFYWRHFLFCLFKNHIETLCML